MIKKVRSIIMALLLCLTMTDIAYAEPNVLPALELYLTQDGYEGNALLAALTDYELAEEEKIWADVYWSLDNLTFQKQSETDAEAWAEDAAGRKLHRVCMHKNQEPLASYLNGRIDRIYVKLEVHSSLETSTFTQVASLERPVAGENVQMIQMAGPGILPNMLAGSRFERYAMFHMTVTECEEGYAAVLPTTQPVGLTLVPEQNLPYEDRMSTIEVLYGVAWEQTEDDPLKFMATEMWSLMAEDYYFVAGNQNFCLKADRYPENPLTHQWMERFKWYCTVHPVAKGYETEIFLEEDADIGILYAKLPLKPTGMSRIEIEASVDGEQNWSMIGVLHAEENPVDYMPSQEDYSIGILSDELVNELLAHGQGTFHVRLKIVNGALGNQCELEGSDGDTYTYSKTAIWTGKYTELPDDGNNDNNDAFQPGNDNDDTDGSGGNNGNVGTDNDGETNGQRPGIGNTGNDDPSNSEKPGDNEPDDSENAEDNEPSDSEKTEDNKLSDSEKTEDNKPSDSEKPEDNKPNDSENSENNAPGNSENSEDHQAGNTQNPDSDSELELIPDHTESEQKPDTSELQSEDDTDVNTGSDNNQSDDASRKKAVVTATAVIGMIGLACGGGAVLVKTGLWHQLMEKITRKTHR